MGGDEGARRRRRLYPEVGDRAYTDLDLLVGRRDFPGAMHLLEELGYEHTIHNWALAEQMLAGQIGMKTATAQIDLHWHLHYSHQDRRSPSTTCSAATSRS